MQTSEFLAKCAKHKYVFEDPGSLDDRTVTKWLDDLGEVMCLLADHNLKLDRRTQKYIDDICTVADSIGIERKDIACMMSDRGLISVLVCNSGYAENSIPSNGFVCACDTVRLWLKKMASETNALPVLS